MRILILNDGSTHEIFRSGAADGVLWIGLTEETELLPVAQLFSDPEKTAVLISTYDSEGAHETRYEGFTKLIQVSLQNNGALIALRKEMGEA